MFCTRGNKKTDKARERHHGRTGPSLAASSSVVIDNPAEHLLVHALNFLINPLFDFLDLGDIVREHVLRGNNDIMLKSHAYTKSERHMEARTRVFLLNAREKKREEEILANVSAKNKPRFHS